MRPGVKRAVIWAAVALPFAYYVTGVALAYYARVSICWFPPYVVTERERIDNALAAAAKQARHDPDFHQIDRASCCGIEQDRLSSEHQVTLGSVARFQWVELVRMRYGPGGNKIGYWLTDQCGRVYNSD